jgi:hypothetical protein
MVKSLKPLVIVFPLVKASQCDDAQIKPLERAENSPDLKATHHSQKCNAASQHGARGLLCDAALWGVAEQLQFAKWQICKNKIRTSEQNCADIVHISR